MTLLSRQHAMASEIARASGALYRAQVKAATGQEVARPSDGPAAAALLVRLRAEASQRAALLDRLSQADPLLSATDAALDEATQVVTRAQEIAVQMASDTLTAEERVTAATEVRSLVAELVRIANTVHGGRYVFAGQAYDRAPFADDGTYLGSSSAVDLHLGDGSTVETGTPGDQVFRGASGGADVFAALDALAAALETGEAGPVQDVLDAMDAAVSHLLSTRAALGARHDFVLSEAARAEDAGWRLDAEVQSIADADLTLAYTELANAQTAYEGVLQVASQALSLSVFDYLR